MVVLTVGSVYQAPVLSSSCLVLITEEKRKIYDRYGKEGLTGGKHFITNIDWTREPYQNSSLVLCSNLYISILSQYIFNNF